MVYAPPDLATRSSDSAQNAITLPPAYLPNLNGIRFIAAFMVFIHHIEQVKWMMQVPNVYPHYLMKNSGKLGVGLFFVLSGFLITYLLLRERDQTGTVSVRNFYARRVLRIWPLYLLIVLLATLVLPQWPALFDYRQAKPITDSYVVPRLALFLFVLPNLAIDFFTSSYLCSPAWSIGVEEQFYILWPHIMRTKKRLAKAKAVLLYGLGSVIIVGACVVWYQQLTPPSQIVPAFTTIRVLLGQFRISLMLIGAAAATLFYRQHPFVLRWLFSPAVQIVGYAVLLTMWLTGFQAPGLNLELYGLLFGLLIVNVAGNPKTIIRLDNRLFEKLGQISYGIYLYHIPVIVLLINVLQPVLPIQTGLFYTVVLYSLSIGITVFIADLSYQYIETPFLRLKNRQFATGQPVTTYASGELASVSLPDSVISPVLEISPVVKANVE